MTGNKSEGPQMGQPAPGDRAFATEHTEADFEKLIKGILRPGEIVRKGTLSDGREVDIWFASYVDQSHELVVTDVSDPKKTQETIYRLGSHGGMNKFFRIFDNTRSGKRRETRDSSGGFWLEMARQGDTQTGIPRMTETEAQEAIEILEQWIREGLK